MKHMTREEALTLRVLPCPDRAIIGASPNTERHSNTVAAYLMSRYDVIPIRPDGMEVAGFRRYPSLDAVPGPIDLVVFFRRAEAVAGHIDEAAASRSKRYGFRLASGVPRRTTPQDAIGLHLIRDVCIAEEHRHLSQASGHPAKGVCTYRGARRHTRTTAGDRMMLATLQLEGAVAWLLEVCGPWWMRRRW